RADQPAPLVRADQPAPLVRADQPAPLVRADQPAPLVLLGHSMGGAIAARFVAEGLASTPAPWWREVDALALSSPALALGMSGFQQGLLAVMSRLAPGLGVGNGLNPDHVSRDPAVVAAYKADPLVHDRISPRLVRFLLDAGEQVRAAAPRWTLPTLLQYAGADRLVAPAGSATFASAAPASVVTPIRYDGFAHEIFNDPERERVLADLTRWLAQRARPAH
ncbi:MAG: lysophospholipase, partial [Burkholderiales bacterium]|nr:lysophospholipase [Burkholderiales bacterium]